jgi:uracil-DNA glycosylase
MDFQSLDPAQIARVLAWYREMGVTSAHGALPIDWRARGDRGPGADFMLPTASPRSPVQGRAPPPKHTTPVSPSPAGALRADEVASMGPAPPIRVFGAPLGGKARPPVALTPASSAPAEVKAASLAELAVALSTFDGCSLKATATNLCLYRGAATAPLMIIGEAPGREEDQAGQPFVGPAGKMLDLMMAALGLSSETDVHMTNLVYWRPPGNSPATAQQVAACAPFLARQIALVAPKVILTLGGPAAKYLLGIEGGIMKIRGKWCELVSAGGTVKVMPTLHPAYILDVPDAKRQVWRDLQALRAVL